MIARERGAQLIHVDPHFTRTSAMCQQYVPIRAGTDIAFLGGLENYLLTNERWFREYVLAYTNATTLIVDDYRDTEDLDGLFCGFDKDQRWYVQGQKCWNYEGDEQGTRDAGVLQQQRQVRMETEALAGEDAYFLAKQLLIDRLSFAQVPQLRF